jgi:DNA-binding response OmpR family regulator
MKKATAERAQEMEAARGNWAESAEKTLCTGAHSTRTVNVAALTLGQMLETDPRNLQFIQTIIRVGYKFLG